MPTLPRVDFYEDRQPTQIVASLEINATQRFGGARSAAGGAVMMLPVETLYGYAGTIQTVSGILRMSGEHEGLSIPSQPLPINQNQLRIPVSDEQLERIEERRSGMQPLFDVILRGTGVVNGLPVVLTTSYPVSIVVPLEEWFKVLAMMGYGERRLIELPAPPSKSGAAWEAASKQLRSASWRLAKGDSGAAMTEARSSLERTLEAVGESVNRPRISGEPFRNFAEGLTKVLRAMHVNRSDDPYGVLADCVQVTISCFGYASDPAHNALDAAERVHAELALSLATTIYTYFGRTLK